jgi:hypothetical protein
MSYSTQLTVPLPRKKEDRIWVEPDGHNMSGTIVPTAGRPEEAGDGDGRDMDE